MFKRFLSNFSGENTQSSPRLSAALFTVPVIIVMIVIFLPITLLILDRETMDLESAIVNQDSQRVEKVLDDELTNLERLLFDYAQWDDTYNYALGRQPDYVDVYFGDQTFINLKIGLLAAYDKQGMPLVFKGFNLEDGVEYTLPFSDLQLKQELTGWLDIGEEGGLHSGYRVIQNRPVILACQPIYDNQKSGPSAGILCFGRFLDRYEESRVSDIAQLQVQFFPIDSIKIGTDEKAALDELGVNENRVLIQARDAKTVAGYSILQDTSSNPVILLKTSQSRLIFMLGENFKQYFIILFISLGLIAFILMYSFMFYYFTGRKAHKGTLERYKTIIEQTREAVLVIQSRDGRIIDANPSCRGILDFSFKEDSPVFLHEIVSEGLRLDRLIVEKNNSFEEKCILKNGKTIEVEISVNDVVLDNQETLVIILRDIFERKQVENALRSSEERFQLAVRGANDGLWDWNLVTDEIYFSPRWKMMLGYSEDEVGSSIDEWFDRVHPDDIWALRSAISFHLRQETEYLYFENRIRQKDGTYRWMLSRGVAYFKDGYATRMAGSQTDITETKKYEEQIKFDALHDPLTGLPNRTLMLDRLRHANRRSKRHGGKEFSILFLDLDRFKRVNDNLGHAVGDQLLKDVAHRIQACLRSMDTIARVSGDEFIILLEDTCILEEVIKVTERVLHSFDQAFYLSGREINLTTSIGVVIPDQDYEDVEEFIRDADIAMNASKEAGRARYSFFQREMYNSVVKRMDLESELRRALENKEFLVYYQPIFSLESDELIGMEALVRWNHPDRGILPPGEFIGVAEETGLIIPMGFWVLRQSCLQLQEWKKQIPRRSPLFVSVNLSTKQFTHENLFEEVQKILEETEMESSMLWLEVTESVLVEDTTSATSTLQQLRQLGVRIEIDDFGTGYSSLSYLQQFPVDGIKIDRSFVNTIHINENDRKIVRTIIELCHSLGITEVAEGIETIEHKENLRELGCWYGQGYLYSRPMDSAHMNEILKSMSGINNQD